MFGHKTTHKPIFLRTVNIVLAFVFICGGVLLISNALSGKTNQHIGWQLRIVGSLAEQFLEVAGRWYESQAVLA